MIVTYLGHQGWSIGSSAGHVLVDPVFRTIGNAGVRLPVWPDREINPDRLGAIAAVVLSHEHSDHFDIDTLHRVPWRGRIYVSDRSSRAMTDLLTDMGYQPERIRPYQAITLPGVRLTALPLQWSLLEPDAYGLLAEGDDGTSFFTGVDGMPCSETITWLRTHCPKRSVDNVTNNYLEPLPELTGVLGHDENATAYLTSLLIDQIGRIAPSRVVFSGQGWSYPPEYSKLNHRFFNVTHERLLPILTQLYPHIRWEAPTPGTRICLSDGPLDRTPATFVVPRATTNRDYEGYTAAAALGRPWSGVTRLPDEEMRRATELVRSRLGQRVHAHAPDLMRRLFTIASDPGSSLIPTVALRLRDDSGNRHFVLDQGWLEFVPAPSGMNLRRDVAGGVEIWASDLLLMADGREEPYLIYETAVRRWSNAAEVIGTALHVHMFLSFGPRLQPAEFAASYRRRLAEVAGAPAMSGSVA